MYNQPLLSYEGFSITSSAAFCIKGKRNKKIFKNVSSKNKISRDLPKVPKNAFPNAMAIDLSKKLLKILEMPKIRILIHTLDIHYLKIRVLSFSDQEKLLIVVGSGLTRTFYECQY